MPELEIPWDVSGYLEAIGWRADLLKTPRDDWDLAPHLGDAGETLPVNPLKADHQLFRWLSTRYTTEVALAHWVRTAAIDAWVPGNRSALIARGLIRGGGAEVSRALLQALAELPYSRKLRNGARAFSMPEVLRRVDELIEDEYADRDRDRGL